MKKILFLILFLTWATCFGATSKYQPLFGVTQNANMLIFKYKWYNQEGQLKQSNFIVPKLEVASSFIEYKKYSPDALANFMKEKMEYEIKNINDSQNNFKINSYSKGQIEIIGTADEKTLSDVSRYLSLKEEEYAKNYINTHNYKALNSNELIIDYNKIISLYAPKMESLAKNISYTQDAFIDTQNILAFYQVIPYFSLSSSVDQDFSLPFKMLYENKGDCDSKLVAAASTIRGIYPNMPIIAIMVDNHIFIGVSILTDKNINNHINFKGKNYLLTEVAGPDLFKIGDLSDRSLNALREGKYKILEL